MSGYFTGPSRITAKHRNLIKESPLISLQISRLSFMIGNVNGNHRSALAGNWVVRNQKNSLQKTGKNLITILFTILFIILDCPVTEIHRAYLYS